MLSRFFIYRPIFASVISIVVLLVGSLAIPTLPVEQTPDITPPTVSVTTQYPGASSEVLNETVSMPIETQVNGVEGMIYMSSTSSADGRYNLTVTFEVGTDIDMATVLVQNRVAIAEPMLPEEVKRQGVVVQKQSTAIVQMISLLSPDGKYDQLYQSNFINTTIIDPLNRVPGVGSVTVFGAKDFGMRIWLDPDRMKALDLTTTDVLNAVREQNVQIAAGRIGAPPYTDKKIEVPFTYTVTTEGRLKDVSQFEDIIVKVGNGGALVRVKDVARVQLGAQNYDWDVFLNGQESIALGIYQLPGANALDIAKGVESLMEELEKSFPPGLEWKISFDTTKFVEASIEEVISTLLIAIVLVIFTVYLFLQDLRTTLIPAATIPVALIGTFAVMLGLDMSINTLSLFGIVLAIGIVVDDAIVVVENTMRIIDEEKLPSKQATEKAMNQITGPVVATTLVLLAVFVPTAMIGGITGRLYQQFAITISVSTVFSAINALTLSPALCGMLLRPTPEKRNFLFRGFEKGLDWTRNVYVGVVRFTCRRVLICMVFFLGILGATGLGIMKLPTGFLPAEDQGYIFVNAMLPEGASLERTTAVMSKVDKQIQAIPGVADTLRVDGYSILNSVTALNGASMFVTLKPWADRTAVQLSAFSIVREANRELYMNPQTSALAFPPPPIMGLGAAGGFDMRIEDRSGASLEFLETVANDIVAEASQDPMLTRMNSNLRIDTPRVYLNINRDKVKRLGIPLQSLYETLQANLGSAYVNDFNLFGQTYRVMAQADAPFRRKIDDVNQLQVRTLTGKMVPLSTLLTIEETAGPRTIFRYNNYESSIITGTASQGYSSGQAIKAMAAIAEQKLPESMGYEWSGVAYQQIAAGSEAPIIFALALLFVFLFLAAQYESWSAPLAVVLNIPIAVLGAIGMTFLCGLTNNVYMQIGLVLLIGMAAKYAILIVEFARQEVAAGNDLLEASAKAARLRFRAILMTALAFLLGVLPLVLATGAGANSRRSLGTAVFGGMLLATIIGVLMIPVLYVFVEKVFSRRKAAKVAVAGAGEATVEIAPTEASEPAKDVPKSEKST